MLFVHQMRYGPAQNFQYLVASARSQTAFLVDPAWDVGALLQEAETLGLRLAGALVTHSHRDHCAGIPEFREKTGLPVYAHASEVSDLPSSDQVTAVEDCQTLQAEDLAVLCMHTPGHTQGSMCYLAGTELLTGDTLFIGTVGRVDLPNSSPEALFWSLRRLARLPDETSVLPGHDYADRPRSTIEQERLRNPYMRVKTLDDFLMFMGVR